MAKFTIEQAAAFAAVQQLINDWAHELDIHNGRNITDLITEDCVYTVGGVPREGRAAVKTFYQERLARLSAQPEGVPIHRHALSGLRVEFRSTDEVSIHFGLIYFTTAGMASGVNHADPAAFADVRMTCRLETDGHWRISAFDSEQIFRRVPA
ncbi:MAG: nuclear transport factor 2 family protein [Asticcacaulis sp.]|nr:nuclear transport factor 2 family protein [Asticcacaulis sp.]